MGILLNVLAFALNGAGDETTEWIDGVENGLLAKFCCVADGMDVVAARKLPKLLL